MLNHQFTLDDLITVRRQGKLVPRRVGGLVTLTTGPLGDVQIKCEIASQGDDLTREEVQQVQKRFDQKIQAVMAQVVKKIQKDL